MKATVSEVSLVESASGTTYQKLTLKEHPARKCISFEKEKFEVNKEYEFRVKENPDTSFVLSLPKSFSKQSTIDIKLECLKLAVELVKSDKVKIEQLPGITKRLQEIYNKL